MRRLSMLILSWLLLAGLLPACTGLEPAAISAGATAAQSGATFFTQGRFVSVELASFDDAGVAVRAAAEELALDLMESEPEHDRIRLVYHDGHGASVVVVVQQMTRTVTRIQADVGTFGENGLASLLMRQTAAKLRAMEAYQGEPGGG